MDGCARCFVAPDSGAELNLQGTRCSNWALNVDAPEYKAQKKLAQVRNTKREPK